MFTRYMYLFFIVASTLCMVSSCKDEPAMVGDLLIEVNRMDLIGVGYGIYSEAYLTSDSYFPPIASGEIKSDVIEVKGINPGNYILQLNAGNNWRIFLQVTAGEERRFTID